MARMCNERSCPASFRYPLLKHNKALCYLYFPVLFDPSLTVSFPFSHSSGTLGLNRFELLITI